MVLKKYWVAVVITTLLHIVDWGGLGSALLRNRVHHLQMCSVVRSSSIVHVWNHRLVVRHRKEAWLRGIVETWGLESGMILLNIGALVHKVSFRLLHHLLLPRVVCGQVFHLQLVREITFLVLKCTLLHLRWPLDRLWSTLELTLSQWVLLRVLLRCHGCASSAVLLLLISWKSVV